MKQPMLPPLAALAAGIAAAHVTAFSLTETLLSALLLAALALAALRAGLLRLAAAACLAAFVMAGAMAGWRPHSPEPRRIDRVLERQKADLEIPARLRGWVREPPEPLDDADRFLLELETVFDGVPTSGGVQVRVRRAAGDPPLRLAYGERIEFLARLREVRNFENPGAFDRVRFLRRKGVYVAASVRPGTPVFRLPGMGGAPWMAALWSARGLARERLDGVLFSGGIDSEPASILRAMLLGERADLPPGLKTDFQKSGAYHVLVISGLHVGVLAFAVAWLLRWLPGPRWARALILAALALGYASLVGANPPALRAAGMLTAYLAARLIYRQRRALNVIAATACVFLLADPELLFDTGFQLSFGAVLLIAGIAAPLLDSTVGPFHRACHDLWDADRDLHLRPPVAQFRVAVRMWLEPLAALTRISRETLAGVARGLHGLVLWGFSLAVVSAVVQVGMALPMAAYFQRVALNGVWSNMALAPLVLPAVAGGLAALVTGWSLPLQVAAWAASTMAGITRWQAQHLPLDFRSPPPPAWLAVLFAASLIVLGAAVHRRRLRVAAGASTLALLAILVAHPFPVDSRPGRLEMTAIDVGQGEALALWLPDGRVLLVDAGGLPDFRDKDSGEEPQSTWFDVGEYVVSPYLWSRSVQRIEALALTHAHADHTGGAPALLENFDVGELWLAADQPEREYRAVLETARRRGTAIRKLRAGEEIPFGEVKIAVAAPLPVAAAVAPNERSLVLDMRYRHSRLLLTGDIGAPVEGQLAERLGCRPGGLLKVAHHGSRESTSAAWLDCVQPWFAVISAGYDNFYSHPHPETIERLRSAGARVFQTAAGGLVSLSTDGLRWEVRTFRQRRREQALRKAILHGVPLPGAGPR